MRSYFRCVNFLKSKKENTAMDVAAKTAFLRRIPLLHLLSDTEIGCLAASAQFEQAKRFQFIYRPNDPAEALYFLCSGRVKLGTYAEGQREIIKDLLRSESVFGESALMGERTRKEFAQVLSQKAEFLAISYTSIAPLLHQNPHFILGCLQHINHRLRCVEDRLAQLLVKDARKRIIEFLLDLAGKEGMQVGYETLVRDFFPQQEIANITGTSRQTVTAVLNDLRKSNLIYFNRHSMLIRDLSRLAMTSEV